MFTDRAEAYATLDGAPGQMLLDALEPVNLKGLGFIENGFRNLTANKRILSPDDLRGLKIRVMENKIQLLTWSTLGANPTPISFAELFTALQQGTVDAQENPFEQISTNKLYEVQKFIMTTNHNYTPMLLFMNLDYYSGLTPDQQAIVQKAARASIDHQRSIAQENEGKARKIIAEHIEIVELTPEQRQAFRAKMEPVFAEVKKQVGNDALVDAFLKQ